MKNCGCMIDLLVVSLIVAKLAGWISISWWLVFSPLIAIAGILVGGKPFNFKEFFRVNNQGKFVYEEYVKQFLRNITTPSKHTSYPFSTKQFRDQLRHTLWLMPGVREAGAMEHLLKQDSVLGEINGYKIINIVKDVKGEDKGAI